MRERSTTGDDNALFAIVDQRERRGRRRRRARGRRGRERNGADRRERHAHGPRR